MNFIVISPQFPAANAHFCESLKKKGVNVLGIGDGAYDSLEGRIKDSLTEYYRVDSLEDYDKVFRAVAYLSYKHGKIDWLESNNEYWLTLDAKLRDDFNIKTGVGAAAVEVFRRKSLMKERFLDAGIPVADFVPVSTLPAAEEFAGRVGFPLIVKPDDGIDSGDTHRLRGWAGLEYFFSEQHPAGRSYIMEQYLAGDIYSYDAIIDSDGEPLYEAETRWPPSDMDVANRKLDMAYYVADEISPELQKLGRAAVKAFGVKSRFVSIEFFRLTKDAAGVAKAGEFAALEANMSPAAGRTTDMMDFAHNTDVYDRWADMVLGETAAKVAAKTAAAKAAAADETAAEALAPGFCAYAARRDGKTYAHSDQEIRDKYIIKLAGAMPQVLQPLFGSEMYMAAFPTEAEAKEFAAFVQELAQ